MRRNKFNAKKTECHLHHTHDSKKEAFRCDTLHQLQAEGKISDLEIHPQFWFVVNGRQVKHDNGRRVGYKADFCYVENGSEVVEDVKPERRQAVSRDFPLRLAVFRSLFPHVSVKIT